MTPNEELYGELASYTLAHGDPAFIHQYIVDAFTAQTADAGAKPIGVAFALAGLCLHVEKGFTGREVQRAHMRMAKKKRHDGIGCAASARGTRARRGDRCVVRVGVEGL